MDGTVWVVSSGEYSDYRVHCVCPTEQDAEKVAAKMRGLPDAWHSDAEVEPMDWVTGDVEPVNILRLSEDLWDDGTTSHYSDRQRVDMPFCSLWDDGNVAMQWRWIRAPIHGSRGGRLEVSGVNHKLVRKTFSDKRAHILAEDALRLRKTASGRTKK